MFTPPSLDERCSRNFTYRDLIESGETYHRLAQEGAPVDNVPRAPETWAALRSLATEILDPLVEAFPALELTYGFGSPRLTRHIASKIAPRLDQHASHECGARGAQVCARGGAAADVRVPGVASQDVVAWLIGNVRFDRLYYYGPRLPVHISWAAAPTGTVTDVVTAERRRLPRRTLRGSAWIQMHQG